MNFRKAWRTSIAESIYQVTSRDDRNGELLGLCPVHGEKNASFSYNYITDVYFCQTCKVSGDLIKLWILVRGFSNLKEGFVSFCREYGLGDEKANGMSRDAGW